MALFRNCAVLGSPPRMRGKDRKTGTVDVGVRITPAYAGKRQSWTSATWLQRDHPRVCGEKGNKVKHCFHDLGSPPRMRGKGRLLAACLDNLGITPACAGKNSAHNMASVIRKDHPRVCGEKKRSRQGAPCVAGSPPRVRGKDGVSGACHSPPGITPAYAGKRRYPRFRRGKIQDHPRVCGEKQSRQRCRMSRTGSPPRMRGKV